MVTVDLFVTPKSVNRSKTSKFGRKSHQNWCGGCSSLICIDSLHKNNFELSPERYKISQDLKDKVTYPPIASHFELGNNILPTGFTSLPMYYYHTYYDHKSERLSTDLTSKLVCTKYNAIFEEMFIPCKSVDPKSSIGKSSFSS